MPEPISTADLTAGLGHWPDADGPLYSRLARSLSRLLESGRIPSGTALPPERHLASALAVSRNTVTAAYAELRRAGWVHSRQGSATVVTGARHSPVAAYKTSGLFANLMRAHPGVMDMTIAVPSAAPVVAEIMADPTATGSDPVEVTSGHGYLPSGYEPLRIGLAETLTGNGLPTAPDELLVTSGAQQAISIVAEAIVRSGDVVVAEEFTYPGALDTMTARGADLETVPVTDTGVDVIAFAQALDGGRPRLGYLVPTFHNPTGSMLDFVGRQHVVRTIGETRVTTVDDLTLSELDYLEPAPPPLAALAPDAQIISVGSMSKVFWGGLRIGWVRAGAPIIEHLLGFKTSADLGTSALAQALAAAMLHRYEETRAWRKQNLARSLEVATNAISDLLPDWDWQMPAGGPHLWVRMPAGSDSTAFAHAALRNGLGLVPGALLAAHDSCPADRIRLPLYPDGDDLVAAVRLMAETWHGRRAVLAS